MVDAVLFPTVGVAISNPFDTLPSSPNPQQKHQSWLTHMLGYEVLTSYNVSVAQNLIKQIWQKSGGYYGKDSTA